MPKKPDSKEPPRGPGRPRERDEPMVPFTMKLEPTQKEKLQRLGGAPWVRKKIDQAKE